MTRRNATVVIFAIAFIVLGLPDFGHGVAWPSLRADLHRPLADLGTFLAVQTVAYLFVAMSTGRLASRWRLEGLVVRSTVASAAGLLIIAVAPGWALVLTGAAFAGAGAGGMDTGFNAAVALRNDRRLMGMLHAGYGAGAAMGPVIVGASLALHGGWRPAYGVFAASSLLLVAPVTGRGLGDAPPQARLGSPRGVVLPCVTFFLYVALEVTIGQWTFTFLTDRHGVGDFGASAWVAVYWVGLTLGRLWLGVRGHAHSSGGLLAASVVGAVLAALLFWLGGPAAPLGLALAGVSLSTVFPLLMLLTPDRVGSERAAAAVGWQTAAASLGAAGGPAAAGLVLDARGVGTYGPVTLVMALALAASTALLRRPPDR